MKCLGRLPASNSKPIMDHFLQVKWFIVALCIGCLLKVIYQYDAILGEASLRWSKFYLTDAVPYCVSSGLAWYSR